jgi:hypothetical protein
MLWLGYGVGQRDCIVIFSLLLPRHYSTYVHDSEIECIE